MTIEPKRLEKIHDLMSREIRPLHNWREFLERWQVAVTMEEMLSLLHVGFGVLRFDIWCHGEEVFTPDDRLLFYFKIADGWEQPFSILSRGDDQEILCGWNRNGTALKKDPAELRRELAAKAFNMLCLNFFRSQEKDEGGQERRFVGYWVSSIVTDNLFPAILNFFRLEEPRGDGRIVVRNLSNHPNIGHNEKQVVSFLLDLATFLWGWREAEFESYFSSDREETTVQYNTEMRARIEPAKLWMLEVLNYLRRLDILDKVALDMSEACLDKLREIALRSKLCRHSHPVDKDRLVTNLDEACLAGSQAAWFLVHHDTLKRAHDRLEEIRQTEYEAEDARYRLEKLTKEG